MTIASVKQRSPNYPGQPLGKAIEDVRALYSKEQRATFPLVAAAGALGYSSLNGLARTRLAALRQYGLLDQKKGEEGRVSDRALTLVLRNPASKEYKEALRQAALEPPLFKAMYEAKRTASDENLKHHLVVNERFTDEGADRFIEAFRQTIAIANLDENGNISGQISGELDDPPKKEGQGMQQQHQTPNPGKFVLTISGGAASFQVEHSLPLSEDVWTQLTAMINAMKPALVMTPDKPESVKKEAEPQKLTAQVA